MSDQSPSTAVADGAVFVVIILATALAAGFGVLTLRQATYGLPRELLHHDVTLGLHAILLGWAGFVVAGLAVATLSLLISGHDTRWPTLELTGLLSAMAALGGVWLGGTLSADFWGAVPTDDPVVRGTMAFALGTALASTVAAVARLVAPRTLRLAIDLVGWGLSALAFFALAALGPTLHTPIFW